MSSTNPQSMAPMAPFDVTEAFDNYVQMDYLSHSAVLNDLASAMDEDVDLQSMSHSELFRYLLGGELKAPPPPPPQITEQQNNARIEEIVDNDMSLLLDLGITPTLPVQPVGLIASVPQVKNEPLVAKTDVTTRSSTAKKSSSSTSSGNSSRAGSPTSAESESALSPSELKKLTSKERRQIRNKLSARTFRERRKEHITSLENKNEEQQKEIEQLRQTLSQVQDENAQLKKEVEKMRMQQALSEASQPSTPRSASDHSPVWVNAASPFAEDAPAEPEPTQDKLQVAAAEEKTTSVNNSPFLTHRQRSIMRLGAKEAAVSQQYADPGAQTSWLVFMFVTSLMQRMTTLFVEALSLSHDEMAASPVAYAQAMVGRARDDPLRDQIIAGTLAPVMEENMIVVEGVKQAGVLEWLYDTMLAAVVEQARIQANEEDESWAAEIWDETVMPLAF